MFGDGSEVDWAESVRGASEWIVYAQASAPRVQEKPAKAGVRVTVRTWRWLAGEAEVNRLPICGGQANFPGTEVLLGLLAGIRLGPLGIYCKARPGLIRLDRDIYLIELSAKAASDSPHHFAVRTDFGDTVVFYGQLPIAAADTPRQFKGGSKN